MPTHIRARVWTSLWSLLAVMVASWITVVPLEGVPHVQDEVVYTLQASALLEGGFGSASPEPSGSSSYHFLLEQGGRRFGVFPTGWPAVLALGLGLGVRGLVNPVLFGGIVLLGAGLARRLRGDRAAMIAAPLLALSPQLVLQGASLMSHTLCALLTLGTIRLLVEPLTLARVLGVGLMVGGLTLTRYLDGLIVCALALPVVLSAPERAKHGLAFMLPLLAAGALIGVHNLQVTGDLWTFPVTAYFDKGLPPTTDAWWRYTPGCNGLGFGEDRGCFPTYGDYGHTPQKALRNLWTNLQVGARLLVGFWPVLLLGLPALLSTDGVIARLSRQAWLLWGGLAVAYSLYWVPGLCYGARFHHAALPGVLVTVVIGVDLLLERWPQLRVLPVGVGALLVWRLLSALPELDGYWGVDGRFQRLQEDFARPDTVVLVAYQDEPLVTLHTPETTQGGLTVRPSLRRGAWIGATGPLELLEYHPELVEEIAQRRPEAPILLYVMSQDATNDALIPLPAMWRDTPQVKSRSLPVDPVTLRSTAEPPRQGASGQRGDQP
ncbi:hypothetical protein L6R46_01655 [Myxococcota bacterium]|jgi:hypothetical protein|nr:hypothetical protein [Myxococcota bacterium]